MAEPPKSNGKMNGVQHANGVAKSDGEAHEHDHDDDVDAPEEGVIEAVNEPLPPPPPAIAELCAAAIRFVASKYKVSLDGTPDTLSLLDQYVRDARTAVQERPESIDLVAPAIGAYLGEVLRQEFGAEWFAEGSYESYRLYFTNVYLAFNPIGMAREALSLQEEEGWNSHLTLEAGARELIAERLEAMPEVDEEEYYLPTTRFDVITGVVLTLRALAEQGGVGDIRFTKEDYD